MLRGKRGKLALTSSPSRGSGNTPGRFILLKPQLAPAVWASLLVQTLPIKLKKKIAKTYFRTPRLQILCHKHTCNLQDAVDSILHWSSDVHLEDKWAVSLGQEKLKTNMKILINLGNRPFACIR